MDFSFRKLSEDDYENILKGWWDRWGWPHLPMNFLPNLDEGGLMISKGEIDICAMFIYFTNSKICYLGFSISNPEYKEKDRSKAIDKLIELSTKEAFNKGYEYVYSVANKDSLIESHKKSGFNIGNSNCSEMIKFKNQKT